MNFESELKQGRFTVWECTKCHKTSWPPNNFCNNCWGELKARPVKEPGILLEWSVRDGKNFGMVQFEDSIRVIGTIIGSPQIGESIKISSCGFDGTPKFTFAPS